MADETQTPAAEDAAHSAAATFEAAPDTGGTAERVLNQDEIDSLLGFDVNADQMQDKSGVRAIINSALVSYERLPMLEIVFDRLVRLMTTSLAQFHLATMSKSAWIPSPPSVSAIISTPFPCPPSWRCSMPRSWTITACSPWTPT